MAPAGEAVTVSRARRLLGWAAAVAAAGAAALCAVAAVGVLWPGGHSDGSAGPATLLTAPSTVPPRAVPVTPPAPAQHTDRSPSVPPSTSPRPLTRRSTTTTLPATTTTTTRPLSPLNSLVGKAVTADPVAPLADVAPSTISIRSIDVSGVPVRPVGVTPDGQLEVPDETAVGWYRLGAAPGQPGATVLAAHVSWGDQPGPFLRLGEVDPGEFVELALADGTSRRYQIVERAQHGKLQLPRNAIWRTTGPETLVLITCGGTFNPDIRRYTDNIVVTAVPVA
jgi:hypothetical protein